MAKPEWQAAGF